MDKREATISFLEKGKIYEAGEIIEELTEPQDFVSLLELNTKKEVPRDKLFLATIRIVRKNKSLLQHYEIHGH